MKNNVQLITYVDRLAGSNITNLNNLLSDKLSGLFSGLHLLPFYYPIDGSDAGFDPIDHSMVDNRLGHWQDVKELGENYEIMADLIVNHMSADSSEFKDVLKNGKQSKYWDLFLTKDKVFTKELNSEAMAKIYRPRPGSCFTQYQTIDAETIEFWTTFTDSQIDIDVESDAGQNYLSNILTTFSQNNIKVIRLDAAGYAIKRAGSSCFMLDDTFAFIKDLSEKANNLGIETLVEIHSYYQTQIEIAKRVDLVYDFALPPLILHSIFNKDFQALTNWLSISPKNCITVLDTHDGIGIIDVGPMQEKPGLLTNAEIDLLVEKIHLNSREESKLATGAAASNVDLYQVNCSYYDALAQNDHDYLIARAIQFFAPGTPQVYYAGLLSETNDMELLAKTNIGRDINRPYINNKSLEESLSKPITKALLQLIKLRNECAAFNGEFSVSYEQQTLTMGWHNADKSTAILNVNLSKSQAWISLESEQSSHRVDLIALLETTI
ncbi:sucrose phosphorylase [Thalassotalea fonticola]|uniref:Sucrose phosphorylase n=1 Tax=Thalassotalea fonticola TaxID=3065649 RepID=A0ABZ0GSS6_9GAMM|nr:sucrose phosphorylase [Colwelliaceae bacterium S1-1]